MEKAVTYCEIKGEKGYVFKVTRRMPKYSISDTRTFSSKEPAVLQVIDWLE